VKTYSHIDDDDGAPLPPDDEDDADLCSRRARHAMRMRQLLRDQGLVLSHDFDSSN
jgi:hypothetical protein